MDSNIQHLIDELLEFDPTLGQREDFSRIIEMMVKSRPQIKLRKDFERELRASILTLASEPKKQYFSWFSLKGLSYFSTGLAFAAFAIFAFRQLDLWPAKNNLMLPTAGTLEAPALGGATNRIMPPDSKGFAKMVTPADAPKSLDSEVRESDKMAAVRNISPAKPVAANNPTKPANEPASAPQAFSSLAQNPVAESAPAPTATADTSGSSDSLMMGDTALGSPAPTPPRMGKIAASSVRYSFTDNLPPFDLIQSVTLTASGSESTQDIPAKSIEVIRDNLAQGGYYKNEFIFDGNVRNLEKPRIETITIIKENEKYTLSALVLDVVSPDANGPKTVTVVLAEGF